MAAKLGISKTVTYKYLQLACRRYRRWTEKDYQILVDGYNRGWPTKKIAQKVGRSPRAVMVAMCRYRQRIRADPQKRKVLYLLKVGLEAGAKPGQVLSAIRRAKILGRGNDVLQL